MIQTNSTLFMVKDNHPVHLTVKEIDKYRNDLESAVVISGKTGLTIELAQQRFFN